MTIGLVEVAGGVAMTFSTSGVAAGAGYYFVGVGIDEVIAGLREYSGQAGVRSGRENALDAVTGNQNVTDTIWFITDAGVDLTAGYKVAIREIGEEAAERAGKNTAEITVEKTTKNGDNAIAQRGTAVFRVQSGTLPNASKIRFALDDAGNIAIRGDDMLYINVNQETRALEFLARRGEGASLVRFELKPEFVEKLRRLAVPQQVGPRFPSRPQLVDPTRAPDQFGIPRNMFDELLENIIPGSGSGL